MYAQWAWPTPIMLRPIERDPALAMPVWDPRENPVRPGGWLGGRVGGRSGGGA